MLIHFDNEELSYIIIALEYLFDYHDDPDAPKSANVINLMNKLKFCKTQILGEHERRLPNRIGQILLKHPHLMKDSETLEEFLDKVELMYPKEYNKIRTYKLGGEASTENNNETKP